jgi:DNA repair exonuclease SbcCD nuclease subunit
MKIALISDTHWGIRNDNVYFHENTKRFLDDRFFPTILAEGVKDVVHCGDLLDHRKYCNTYTAHRLRRDFMDVMGEWGIHYYQIVGNHDTFFKNTNEVNTFAELYGMYPFDWYEEATEVVFGDTKILMVPWICDANREKTLELVASTDAQIVFGHLELSGFQMYRDSMTSHGMDPNVFRKFDVVCSGHFHHKSTVGNINYLGAHAEFTWSDYNDPRGFHIFDTETRELKFYQNPYKMFHKVFYDDTAEMPYIDLKKYENSVVKVVVKNKTNTFWFDKFIEKLEAVNPISMQIVEDHLNLDVVGDEDLMEGAETTLDLFRNYVDAAPLDVDRDRVMNKLTELYNEAKILA